MTKPAVAAPLDIRILDRMARRLSKYGFAAFRKAANPRMYRRVRQHIRAERLVELRPYAGKAVAVIGSTSRGSHYFARIRAAHCRKYPKTSKTSAP